MRGTVVTDTFSRTSASGWGSADTGQAWTGIGVGGSVLATDFTVGSGFGKHSVPATNGYRLSYLAGFSQSFVDLSVIGSVNAIALGAPIELANFAVRGVSTSSYYTFRVQVEPTQAVTAKIFNPGGTQLGSITVPGITYIANLQLQVRVQAIGRILRMKVWKASDPEPAAWILSVTDSTYTGAGFIGLRSGIAAGNTNTLPLTFLYSNFTSALLPDFPNDPLPLTVLAAFGANLSTDPSTWPWTNITNDVRAGTVTITPGRGDEISQASPAGCSFQLLNDSEAYSAYNPAGPNYPYVRRNTPIWVLADPATRFFGYANGFTPSWDITGRQAVVSVSASGILRRLTQGKTPLRSALYRFLATTDPVAWWTLEDGEDSTQAASGLLGGTPMTVVAGIMDFVGDAPAGGGGSAQPAPTAANALSGTVAGASSSAWQFSAWTRGVQTDPEVGSYYVPAEVRTDSGKIFRIIVQGLATITLGLAQYDSESQTSPTNEIDVTNHPTIDGDWHLLQATLTQSGSNANASLYLDGTLVGSATWAGVTIGRPVSISSIGDFRTGEIASNMQTIGISHIAVHNTATLVDQYEAGLGYAGETATARLTRLCAEEGVPLTITGTSTTAMGPQGIATFVNLLRECESADLGLLYDGVGSGLDYIARSARYNQPAALTLDMSADPPQVAAPFAPVDDDQRNRNLYKVDRKNGSSATYGDVTGPLGTDAIGVYDSSVTLNVATDDVLPGYASWLVHQGTVEGLRYPSLNLDLGAVPSLIDDWVGARLNSRIDVLNVDSKATGHAPGTVSLLDEGYTETLAPFRWSAAANCSPERAWRVAALDTTFRLEMAGQTLAAPLTAGATTLSLATAATFPLFSTKAAYPADFPIDLMVAGHKVRVTDATGSTSPQTLTCDPTPNTTTIPAGTPVTLLQPACLAL